MSVHVISWVLKHSDEDVAGRRLVLLVLADKADDDGTKAYPSVQTIAREARMSERGVRYALRALEESGRIERVGVHTRAGTHEYRVVLGHSVQEGQPVPPGKTQQLGGQNTTQTVSQIAPKPSFNHPETKSPRAHEREAAPEGTSSPSSIVDERRALADHVRGILQRGVDGLTTDEYCKPVGRGAVIAAIGDAPWELAEAAAIEARSIAQSQNRAPNIVALFAAKLRPSSEMAA